MKKYRFYGGLFVTPLLITTSCSYLTNNVKNTNDYSPPLEQAKHAQTQLLAFQTILNEKYKRKISGLFGFPWLLNNHHPDRKIIHLEDWSYYT